MGLISYSIYNGTSIDPFTSTFFLINDSSDGIFSIGLILFVAIMSYAVSFYRTQDIGKSGSISLTLSSFISIILYYWGYAGNYSSYFVGEEFLSTVFLFSIIIINILVLVGVNYNKKGE